VFYACDGTAFAGYGVQAANNRYFLPNQPALPFQPSGCVAEKVATLQQWQAMGLDKGSTISSNVTQAQMLQWAKDRLGM